MRWALLLLAAGCATTPTNKDPLLVSATTVPSERLEKKLSGSALAYFRFINIEFASEVCECFKPVLATMPTVNLHGDAHIEQYAITPHSAGLADFDDSVSGPPVLDIVRYAVSVELAIEQRGWTKTATGAAERFLAAYERGLSGEVDVPEPAVVARSRAKFTGSREAFLASAVERMEAEPEPRKSEAEAGYQRYVDFILQLHPEWKKEQLALKQWGRLRSSGIGSARSARFLVRIEGPTTDPNDDVILEAKEVRDLSAVPCIQTQRGDAIRIVAGAANFSDRTDPYLAVIPRGPSEDVGDPPWWIQSWSPDYGEVDVDDSFESPAELMNMIDAVGVQMAHGHIRRLPPPYDRQLAGLIGRAIDQNRPLILETIANLTRRTNESHQAFRKRR